MIWWVCNRNLRVDITKFYNSNLPFIICLICLIFKRKTVLNKTKHPISISPEPKNQITKMKNCIRPLCSFSHTHTSPIVQNLLICIWELACPSWSGSAWQYFNSDGLNPQCPFVARKWSFHSGISLHLRATNGRYGFRVKQLLSHTFPDKCV